MNKQNRNRFTPKKQLGQNFIMDNDLLDSLVHYAGITPTDSVIEIGTGFGTLTDSLLKCAKDVTTIEVDETLIPVLRVKFALNNRVRIIHADVMKIDFAQLLSGLDGIPKVVANIPYYITTDILLMLFGFYRKLNSISLLVQKEAAEKILALPGSTSYSLISLLSHYYSDPVFCLDVPRERFHPAPKVDSSFIRMNIKTDAYFRDDPELERKFLSVCETLFFMRRKTILNNLTARYRIDREKASQMLMKAGINPNRRGETLDLPEIYRLTESLFLGI